MIKVIIVDDDVAMVNGLEKMIDWNAYGFTIVGKAYNGKDALNLVKESCPELLITDISMPLMDGLELIEEVKKVDKDIISIILTCHEDFDMAREALRLNTEDYLVKISMTKDHLIETLMKVKDKVNVNKAKAVEKKRVNQVIADNQKNAIRMIFNKINYGIITRREEAEDVLKIYEKLLPPDVFYVLGIQVANIHDINAFSIHKEKDLIEFVFRNILEECLQGVKNKYIYACDASHYIVILWNDYQEDYLYESMKTSLKLFKVRLKECLNFQVNFGITKKYKHLIFLPDAIQELQDIYENAFYSTELVNKLSLITYKRITYETQEAIRESFKKNLFLNTDDDVKREMQNIYNHINEGAYDVKAVRDFLNQLLKEIEIQSIKLKLQMDFVAFENETLAQCIHKLTSMIVEYRQKKENAEKPMQRKEILIVKEYIDFHLKENVSCDAMASMINMNPSYFSRLFKKEMGKSFTEYLNEVRINKAMNLLEIDNLTMEEIACEIGLQNKSCFYRLFKKSVGVTPGKYREKILT